MQSSYSWIEADRKLFSPYLKLFRGVVKALDSIFFVGGEDWGGVYVEYSMVLIGLIVSLGFHRIEGGGICMVVRIKGRTSKILIH